MKKAIFSAITIVCTCSIVFSACAGRQGQNGKADNSQPVNQEPAAEEVKNVEETQKELYRVYSCAYDGFVNMREQPSFSADKCGVFKNGPEGAALLEDLEDWLKIRLDDGLIGYVPAKFVQDDPTVEYTGNVTVDWIEGCWSSDSGFRLMVFKNGTWEYGYEEINCCGRYIMQNNQIKFTTLWKSSPDISSFNEILEIDESSDKLGSYSRICFIDPEEKKRAEMEDEFFYWEYGHGMTKEEFKEAGNIMLQQLEALGR